MAEFDEHAERYQADLAKALSISGEPAEYFARGRIRWLAEQMASEHLKAGHVLDFGCGTGGSVAEVVRQLEPREYLGVDPSESSLAIARARHPHRGVSFEQPAEHPGAVFDVAFCNGVIHHIPLDERQMALDWVFRALKPGGRFALFENSRWNPATRWVMSRCQFDLHAVPLDAREARQRLRDAGFRVLRTRYLFIFPSCLAGLRFLEAPLSPLPLGTQYVVWSEKPLPDTTSA